MQIVCPHCTTSYAVDPATFGTSGRTVRCVRCKETWLAYPEHEVSYSLAPASDDSLAGWDDLPPEDDQDGMPMVESPSISGNLPEGAQLAEDADWTAVARYEGDEPIDGATASWSERLGLGALSLGPLARIHLPFGLPAACAAMGAVVLALTIWRADVVRLMPQTAAFFKMTGLGVNLRGLVFQDVRISTELVDNKPVLVIEGDVVNVAKKHIDVPRLRFVVLDEHGTEIYGWNAVLEHPALDSNEKAWFKSRLASPPPDGREIAVRFFNRRDIAAGGA
jgi:predicted Zn finger-like uncharacterized protein